MSAYIYGVLTVWWLLVTAVSKMTIPTLPALREAGV